MGIIWMIMVGAVVGFFATRLLRIESDVVTTVAIGIGGALIGGVLIRFILLVTGLLAGFVGAMVGALLLIWLWQTYVAK